MGKRIVSFSLYGTNPLYLEGAVRNAAMVPRVYPGWIPRFYLSEEIETGLVTRLEGLGAEVRFGKRLGSFDGTFWRFLAASDPEVEVAVFRDTDSRPSEREYAAVCEWIESGKALHLMRDHPEHRVLMMAGMWGCVGGAIPDMKELISRWGLWGKKGVDQVFLREVVYPRFRGDLLVHSDLYCYGREECRPFPIERSKGEFVGAVVSPDRDTLTEEELDVNARKFQGMRMQRLSAPARRIWIKPWMRLKQWFRGVGVFCWMLMLVGLLGMESTVRAQEVLAKSAMVEYDLDFQEAHLHLVRVRLTVPSLGGERVRLMMPVWTPGSYMVREYARQVETIRAFDGQGSERVVEKVDKNHWEVESKGTDRVVIEYQLYGREMGVRTNWIEDEFAFITGAATFLTSEGLLDHPHVVRCKPREGWKQIATSLLSPKGEEAWVRRAENFDELIDSPLVLGTIDIRTETIGGVEHYLATAPFTTGSPQVSGLATNRSEAWWDTEKAMADVVKLVEVEQKFWGEVPYNRYWFLNLITESGGGLEHDNSTVLMASRWAPRQRSKYVDWLGLVSHEFFHTWNVRRLRPKTLQRYDYNQEQYFKELWVAEGLTSYYDDLFVVRAGLCTPKEYLERLSKSIQGYQNAPGRLVQNVLDSSFDSWIKFYRPDENAANSRISYYVKGALIGMLLDAKIRMEHGGEKSLDDCMRLLWQRHRQGGYENEDFLRIVAEVGSKQTAEWLERELASTQELDYTPLLEAFGLQWKPKEGGESKSSEQSKSGLNDAVTGGQVTVGEVGMELSNSTGRVVVEKVMRGGAASRAGVQVGDEVLGLGEQRVVYEQWGDLVGTLRRGDAVRLLIARRGRLLEKVLEFAVNGLETAEGLAVPSWNLQRMESPGVEQEKLWRGWLSLESSGESAAHGESASKGESGAKSEAAEKKE
jgi:predicted metalloprotease with PDZ domain